MSIEKKVLTRINNQINADMMLLNIKKDLKFVSQKPTLIILRISALVSLSLAILTAVIANIVIFNPKPHLSGLAHADSYYSIYLLIAFLSFVIIFISLIVMIIICKKEKI